MKMFYIGNNFFYFPAMTTIACPEDCGVSQLPDVAFEDCNPQIFSSELQELYVGREDAIPFIDITDATEWNNRISETTAIPEGSTFDVKDLLRPLTIIGDIPAPTKTTKDISGGRTITTEIKYLINFEIDDMGDANWQFAQAVQCGKGAYPVIVWPRTKSGHVLGGNDGISGTMAIDHILPRGADGIQTLQGVLTFIATVFPNRDLFPLA